MLLRNDQQTTFKVNSKYQFSKIAEPQAFLNLLVFLFRFLFFWGTEIIVNNKISRDALQKDCFSNFKIKWLVILKWKMISSRNELYQMLIADRELIFYLAIYASKQSSIYLRVMALCNVTISHKWQVYWFQTQVKGQKITFLPWKILFASLCCLINHRSCKFTIPSNTSNMPRGHDTCK